MNRRNSFKSIFENKIIENDIELSLNEGKLNDFLKKQLGSLVIGSATAFAPIDSALADQKIPTSITSQVSDNEKAIIGNQVLIIAQTLYGEARGERKEGMQRVASVIYNRANGDKNKFANICLEKKQFSCWDDIPSGENLKFDANSESFKTAMKIALEMMTGKFKPLSFGGVEKPKFYCNTSIFNSRNLYKIPRLKFIADVKDSGKYKVYGNHVFFNPVEKKKSSLNPFRFFTKTSSKTPSKLTYKSPVKIPSKVQSKLYIKRR